MVEQGSLSTMGKDARNIIDLGLQCNLASLVRSRGVKQAYCHARCCRRLNASLKGSNWDLEVQQGLILLGVISGASFGVEVA